HPFGQGSGPVKGKSKLAVCHAARGSTPGGLCRAEITERLTQPHKWRRVEVLFGITRMDVPRRFLALNQQAPHRFARGFRTTAIKPRISLVTRVKSPRQTRFTVRFGLVQRDELRHLGPPVDLAMAAQGLQEIEA